MGEPAEVVAELYADWLDDARRGAKQGYVDGRGEATSAVLS